MLNVSTKKNLSPGGVDRDQIARNAEKKREHIAKIEAEEAAADVSHETPEEDSREETLAKWLHKPRTTRALIVRMGLHWLPALRASGLPVRFARGRVDGSSGLVYWLQLERRSKAQRRRLAAMGVDPDTKGEPA